MARRPNRDAYVKYKGMRFIYVYDNPEHQTDPEKAKYVYENPSVGGIQKENSPTTQARLDNAVENLMLQTGQPLDPQIGENAMNLNPSTNRAECLMLSWMNSAGKVYGYRKRMRPFIIQIERKKWFAKATLPPGAAGIGVSYHYDLVQENNIEFILKFPLLRDAGAEFGFLYGASK